MKMLSLCQGKEQLLIDTKSELAVRNIGIENLVSMVHLFLILKVAVDELFIEADLFPQYT